MCFENYVLKLILEFFAQILIILLDGITTNFANLNELQKEIAR